MYRTEPTKRKDPSLNYKQKIIIQRGIGTNYISTPPHPPVTINIF
jgi:hypothetical protein